MQQLQQWKRDVQWLLHSAHVWCAAAMLDALGTTELPMLVLVLRSKVRSQRLHAT